MAQSLSKILVHLVFSTKSRQPLIAPDIEGELHAYIVGICRQLDSPSLIVNGTSDHLHVLFRLSKNLPLMQVVQEVKRGSSKWVKQRDRRFQSFYWQGGYGAFSIGQSNVEQVTAYIRNQKAHHRKMAFQDELRALFRKYEIEFDERYVWD